LTSKGHLEGKKGALTELQFRIDNLKSDIEDEKEKTNSEKNVYLEAIEGRNREQLQGQKEGLSKIMGQCESSYVALHNKIMELRNKIS